MRNVDSSLSTVSVPHLLHVVHVLSMNVVVIALAIRNTPPELDASQGERTNDLPLFRGRVLLIAVLRLS